MVYSVERRRQVHLEYRVANRKKLHKYFEDHPCVDCGESDIRCLEFDHRDRSEKSYNVSSAISSSHRSWNTVLKEIAKCDVRCANCHRKRTATQMNWFLRIRDTDSSNSDLPGADARKD